MRKTFLAITLFLAFSKAALAQFGNCTASEMRTYVDSATGSTITMLTDTMKNDRFFIRLIPCGQLMANIYCSGLPAVEMTKR